MAGSFGRPLRLFEGAWTDGAVLTNPTDTTTIVQVTGLQAGAYLVGVSGAGSVAWVYDIQHQNSAGVAQHTQRRRPAAGNEDYLFGSWIGIAAGDIFIALLVGGITGQLQMSLHTQRGE